MCVYSNLNVCMYNELLSETGNCGRVEGRTGETR